MKAVPNLGSAFSLEKTSLFNSKSDTRLNYKQRVSKA